MSEQLREKDDVTDRCAELMIAATQR
jgi:hypothetical protein